MDLTVIDRNNHHLFQPLLYQVATAALSPADIASPIRTILNRQRNTSVIMAQVTGIDRIHNEVILGARRIPFDYLVVATGARHSYFGHDGWAAHAYGIKDIRDAVSLRGRILLAFEKAEVEAAPEERRRLLGFVVVGGGPTGVEIAGAIAELARKTLAFDFRTIGPRETRIILVEGGPRLLPGFDMRLSEAARRPLEDLGVEARLSAMVTDCDKGGVSIGSERIDAGTVVWGAGVRASEAGSWLEAETDRIGRGKVEADLSVPGYPHIFVIGDTAHVPGMDGKPLPGVAPVAKQEGRYVAKLIEARIKGRDHPPLRYRGPGSMATIGRRKAVVHLGRIHLSGYAAWWLIRPTYRPAQALPAALSRRRPLWPAFPASGFAWPLSQGRRRPANAAGRARSPD